MSINHGDAALPPQASAPKIARVPLLNLRNLGLAGAGPAPPVTHGNSTGQSGATTFRGGSAGSQPLTFDIGVADQDRPTPGGTRTPKAGRLCADRSKPPSASPMSGAPTTVSTTLSSIMLTPFDDNTYQQTTRTASMGEPSPMAFTPPGMGNDGAGLQTVAGGSHAAPISPPPFQRFPSVAEETAPTPLFHASVQAANHGTGAAAQATVSGHAAPPAASDALESINPSGFSSSLKPEASAPSDMATPGTAPLPARTSGGEAPSAAPIRPAAAPAATAALSGAAGTTTTTTGPSASQLQIPIPRAREVQNLFSSLAKVHTGPGGNLPGRDGSMTARGGVTRRDTVPQRAKGGNSAARGPPSVPYGGGAGDAPAATCPFDVLRNRGMPRGLASASAGATSAATGKKLMDVQDIAGCGAAAESAGQAGGNDCQPIKDKAPKSVRTAADSSARDADLGSIGAVPAKCPTAAAAQDELPPDTAPPAGTAAADTGAASESETSVAGPYATPASATGTAATPGATGGKAEAVAAALGVAAVSAAVSATKEAGPQLTSPELLSAVVNNLARLLQRFEAATSAAAAAKASKASPEAAAAAVCQALADDDSPAIRTVLEELLRTELLVIKPSTTAACDAGLHKPAASISSMLGKLKLDDPQAGPPDKAEPAVTSVVGKNVGTGGQGLNRAERIPASADSASSQAFGGGNGIDAAAAPAAAAAAPGACVRPVFGVTSSYESGSGSVERIESFGESCVAAASTCTGVPQMFEEVATAASCREEKFAGPEPAAAPPLSPRPTPFAFGSTKAVPTGGSNVGSQAFDLRGDTACQTGDPYATFGFGSGNGFQTAASDASFSAGAFGAAAPTAATAAGRPTSDGSATAAGPAFDVNIRPEGSPTPSYSSSAGGASPMSITPQSSCHQQEARRSSSSISWNGGPQAAGAATPISSGEESRKVNVEMWLTVKQHYARGDLQLALVAARELQRVEAVGSSAATEEVVQGDGSAPHVEVPEVAALAELADAIERQLKLKEDGNAAFKAGRHKDAVDSYTGALALDCCPVFAAVLHSNRAAAYHSQGQLAEAVADCCRARALDPSFYRASARLATLMVELRRTGEAQKFLEPLLKLGAQDCGSGPSPKELSRFQEQLEQARTATEWQKTPQHYKLLGLSNTCSEEDVRKAYLRLALKHHPDKAMAAVRVVLSLRGPAGGAPYCDPAADRAELEERVRKEAAWLFSFINQANEELFNKDRRQKVDQLLVAEQPPAAGHGDGMSSNPYGSSFYAGSRYGGYANNHYSFRPSATSGAAPSASFRTRTTTGSGATGASSSYGAYGGYGSYGYARPASNGGAAPPRGFSSYAAGAGRPGGGARGGYAGYARGGGGGASRAASGGRKWYEGGAEDSAEDGAGSFHF